MTSRTALLLAAAFMSIALASCGGGGSTGGGAISQSPGVQGGTLTVQQARAAASRTAETAERAAQASGNAAALNAARAYETALEAAFAAVATAEREAADPAITGVARVVSRIFAEGRLDDAVEAAQAAVNAAPTGEARNAAQAALDAAQAYRTRQTAALESGPGSGGGSGSSGSGTGGGSGSGAGAGGGTGGSTGTGGGATGSGSGGTAGGGSGSGGGTGAGEDEQSVALRTADAAVQAAQASLDAAETNANRTAAQASLDAAENYKRWVGGAALLINALPLVTDSDPPDSSELSRMWSDARSTLALAVDAAQAAVDAAPEGAVRTAAQAALDAAQAYQSRQNNPGGKLFQLNFRFNLDSSAGGSDAGGSENPIVSVDGYFYHDDLNITHEDYYGNYHRNYYSRTLAACGHTGRLSRTGSPLSGAATYHLGLRGDDKGCPPFVTSVAYFYTRRIEEEGKKIYMQGFINQFSGYYTGAVMTAQEQPEDDPDQGQSGGSQGQSGGNQGQAGGNYLEELIGQECVDQWLRGNIDCVHPTGGLNVATLAFATNGETYQFNEGLSSVISFGEPYGRSLSLLEEEADLRYPHFAGNWSGEVFGYVRNEGGADADSGTSFVGSIDIDLLYSIFVPNTLKITMSGFNPTSEPGWAGYDVFEFDKLVWENVAVDSEGRFESGSPERLIDSAPDYPCRHDRCKKGDDEIKGAFYGPRAEEVAGVFKIKQAFGAFGGDCRYGGVSRGPTGLRTC